MLPQIAPILWREARRNLLIALRAGRPISFCWQVYQIVIGAYQARRGIAFRALAPFDRAAMIADLESLT